MKDNNNSTAKGEIYMPITQCDKSPDVSAGSGVSIFRKIVSYLVILTLSFSPMAAYPTAPAVSPDLEYKAALSRLDDFMSMLSQLRRLIDRSQFETDALLEKLNFDAGEIIEFVTKEIHFEQYPGLLRGVQGTLMSQAGNSLDQAVLLAALLNDAGYEASIKRATLTDHQAGDLVRQIGAERSKQLPLANNISSKELLSRMLQTVNLPEDKIELFLAKIFSQQDVRSSDVFHDADKDAAFIHSVLKENNQALKDREITDELRAEAKDYFWVEYRLGPSDQRVAVHPTLAVKSNSFNELKVLETFKSKVPQKLQHQFRFQVFNETKTGDRLTVTPLMKAWQRPAANLIGKRLVFTNVADGLKKLNDLKAPSDIAKNTKFITPVFTIDGKPALELDPFDLNGTVIDLSVLKMGGAAPAGLFQTLGNKMESATQSTATDGVSKDENYRTLSAQWVEYTLISPDGKEKQIKRSIIDRISLENRLSGKQEINQFQSKAEIIWKLAVSNEFLVSPGRYPEAYTLDRYLQRIVAARAALEMAIYSAYHPDDNPSYTAKQLAAFNDNPTLWLMSAIDTDILSPESVRNYQYEPALLIINSGITYSENALKNRFAVDIANTGQRVVRKEGSKLFSATKAAILSGSWATRLEEVNFISANGDASFQWNTRQAFKLAKKMQIPLKLLTPDKQQELMKLQTLSPEARQQIAQDLQKGYMVIVPERPVTNQALTGWWRIHPDTGETLGIISGGLGGSITEYMVTLSGIALTISASLAAFGLLKCLSDRTCSPSGCFKTAGIGFVLGFAMGMAVGWIILALIPEAAVIGAGSVTLGAAGVSAGEVAAFSGGVVLDVLETGGVGPISQIMPTCVD